MNKKKFNSSTQKSLNKLLGLPLKIPIVLDDIELGTVTIGFNMHKDLMSFGKQGLQLTALMLMDLAYMGSNLNKNICISYKLLRSRAHKHKESFLLYLYMFYAPHTERPWSIMDDEDIFEIIKTEGPISLQNSSIQMRMSKWLSDENIANVKLSALKKSLMEHASVFPKKGRTKEEVLQMIDNKIIREVYSDFTSIIKIAKKKRKSYGKDEILKQIKDAAKIHFHSEDAYYLKLDNRIYEMIEEAKKRHIYRSIKKSDDKKKFMDETVKMTLEHYYNFFELFGPPTIISELLKKDQRLMNLFMSYEWYPNEFARKLLAKLLDISESKIHKILYTNTS